jgi:hypothetical protein
VLRVRDETFDQSVKTGDWTVDIALHNNLSLLIKLVAVEPENGK